MNKKRLFVLIIIGLFLVSSSGCRKESAGKGEHQLTGKQIIDKMAHAYSSCKSYYDEGVVTTVFHDKRGRRTEKLSFTTAFARPDRFRFEFREFRNGGQEYEQYIVWRDGESVRTWWSIQPGIENETSLGMAIAGATGVSGGSAYTIPSLLLPDEIGGRGLTDLTRLEVLDDEDVNAVPCSKIQGRERSGDVNTLWVEKGSYLVRKIAEQHSFSDFWTETTTTYNPQFDVDILPAQLEFNPPVE